MDRRRELAELVARHMTEDGVRRTELPRVSLIRSSRTTEPLPVVYEPTLCLVAQGRKQVMLGDTVFQYDTAQFLVASVEVPVIGQVIEATPEEPYLCFCLHLDTAALGQLVLDTGIRTAPSQAPGLGISLGPVSDELLEAVIRLVRLLDAPRDQAILAPMAEREILYRLLVGGDASKLLQIVLAESKLQQVNRAIAWIKRNFAEPFSIDTVASEARMSSSALHQHFKAVTGTSPLQYQKQIRLQEARRLILTGEMDAATAGFRVGYESPSQFSREYSRLFGAPPLRDAAKLRGSVQAIIPRQEGVPPLRTAMRDERGMAAGL
ncbi:AraC family transcriptional regulator [Arenibaculum pallidiluteum]|uniref:AraC family transcriptional regulator n=1 Tax=Arenibaculum pallidiluteum TaxID=2812559 RepID=UPI001A95F463|nr:AraC family transcriptional regulator [Arenibaculum pallidiluteum]